MTRLLSTNKVQIHFCPVFKLKNQCWNFFKIRGVGCNIDDNLIMYFSDLGEMK